MHKGNQVDTPTRMSATYPRPNRKPPYWLSLPRNLQARVCQLWSGRAVTQKFLSVIDRENFEANCPFDDGVGMLTHYLYNCKTTANWRLVVASNTRDRNVPSLKDFGEKYIHYILQLIDHTALGSHSFSKEKGRSFLNPERKFWTPVGIPLSGKDNMKDLDKYQEPFTPLVPTYFPTEYREASFIIPDKTFDSENPPPPFRWFEHTRPLPPATERIVTRRNIGRHLSPPGRPPDPSDRSDPASPDPRSSSPDLFTFSDL